MVQDDILYALVMFCVVAYIFYVWLNDLRFFIKNSKPRKGAFAGATPVSLKYVILSCLAALALLATHIWGEESLGISGQQTRVGGFALLSWTAAAFIEELIFRGYFVIQNKGLLPLVLSALGFSVVFALAHPFLWDYSIPEGGGIFDGVWSFELSAKTLFSTFSIFECSLLFYLLRFLPQNRYRSLLPCFCAHLTYNWGVFAAKLAQGFIQ